MNMPDPQAFAATWMNQLANPTAWQGWMQLPASANLQAGATNPLAGVFKDFGVTIAASRLETLRQDYLKKAGQLWQDFMSGKTPALHDKRFSSSEWSASPLSAFTAASYLLNSEFMLALADAVEAGPRERQKIRFTVQQMVDAMSPANFLATNPEVQAKLIETKGESLTKGLQNMLADIQKGRISQSDESAFEVGVNVGTAPGQVVYENELFQLIQYSPATPNVRAVPLLMIPPCINKFYILDLQPENSLVRYVVGEGNTVFMVSWRNPDKSMASLTWDDYVERGAIEAIDVVRDICGQGAAQDKVHVFGFCVGGTIAATALSVLAARGRQPAASLTLLTTLLDFSDTGVLEVFIDEAQVGLREQALAKGGIMPGRDLATTFSALRPNDLVWNYVQQNYLKGKVPPAFDLLYWNADSTNLPGPMFCSYLRNMYLENKLKVPGKLSVCGVPVDLGRIDCPTFIYGSREDHIVPWQAAFASMNLLNPKNAKANRFVLGASGHIAGVINPASKNKRSYWVNEKSGSDKKGKGEGKSGPRTPEDWIAGAEERKGSWWPEWSRFLQENGGAEVPAPAQPGNERYLPSEPAPGRYVKVRAG